jgi:hypothetical protein
MSLQLGHNARLCPLCSEHNETVQHFLSCQQTKIQQLWKASTKGLTQKITKYCPTINHQLVKLIEFALTHWQTIEAPPLPAFLKQKYIPLFNDQKQIGWNKILKGGSTICGFQTCHLTNPFARQWIAYTIQNIWYVRYDEWKYRCNTNHGDNPTTQDTRSRQ